MTKRDDHIQKLLDAPAKWVGMYIGIASVVCTIAMAADMFHGLRNKKLWFPCKYFSLNATFLTLLAVVMKPSVDLTDELHKDVAYLTKITSLTFMCVAMANFMSSLGSMNNQSILTNIIALGILALTVLGNTLAQIILIEPYEGFDVIMFEPTMFILVLFFTLVSSAIAVPNIKRSLELKYQEMHKVVLREEHAIRINEKVTIVNQIEEMKKYWVMAETSSTEFVMARSVLCTTSSAVSFLSTFTLGVSDLGIYIWTPTAGVLSASSRTRSSYNWSINWILAIQSIGMIIGVIAPTLRWLNNVSYKCSTMSYKSFRKEFNIESYWIQTLLDWRDGLSTLQITDVKCQKYFHGAKWLILNICMGVQILVVLLSKVVVFVSVLLMIPFLPCFVHIKKVFGFISILVTTCVRQHVSGIITSDGHVGVELGDDIARNFNRYVILLEGEPELSEKMVKRICDQANKVLKRGKRQQAKNLITLLHKFGNFSGVSEFDSIQVPGLHSQEPRNCWTLPLVTLTSVAIALPNVANHKAKQLLSSVGEGMALAKLIDEASNTSGELENVIKAANVTWAGVILYRKWQNTDLHRSSFSCKNSEEILRELSTKAEFIVKQFKREVTDSYMEIPLNWPIRVIAANSMYRICETVMLSITWENGPTEEDLFEKLSMMIADILAACLTNLPQVINTMCHQSAIEKREKSVREAFLLMGKTEGILELLQKREWPSLHPCDKMLHIDEWRAFFQQDNENPASSASSSSTETMATPLSEEENLVVTVDC